MFELHILSLIYLKHTKMAYYSLLAEEVFTESNAITVVGVVLLFAATDSHWKDTSALIECK